MSGSFRGRFVVSAALLGAAVVQVASAGPPHRLVRQPTIRTVTVDTEFPRAGRQFGFGGGRGGVQQDVAIVAQFDDDGNGRLDARERHAALPYVESLGLNRGRGGRGMMPLDIEPGPAVSPASVRNFPASTPLYEPRALRTFFLEFSDEDWEKQLMAFKRTDVRVPATLWVDGQKYVDVGVQFHGNSSFSGVPAGQKHSLNLSLDFAHDGQRLNGYRTVTLLNSHEDPSYVRAVLYLHVARSYLPASKANFVRVVINGESWGVYPNVEHFNTDFIKEWFPSGGGARWKVPGSPGGRGGLEYLGDDPAPYKRTYEIKSADDSRSWEALIELTRVLNGTPLDRLEAALRPILDVDGALKFLALDNALVNNDGYWTRASDYSIYLDPSGRFHVIPYDVNETWPSGFAPARGGRGGNAELDPLWGLNDSTKPLRSRLLAVPALRDRYLGYVRDIATRWLDWRRLEPIVREYQSLIEGDMRTDTRKLDSFEEFEASAEILRQFVIRRQAVLLDATRP